MTAPLTGTAGVALPALVDRDEGARLAREELAERIYGQAEPSLLTLVYDRVREWLATLSERVAGTVPGGWWVLGPVLVVVVGLAVVLLVYMRPARRARQRGPAIDTDTPLSAADHRAAAERAAAAGDHADAIRERLRAITRDLEERAIISPRPGRTATELAAETSVALPARRDALYRAAREFNDVAYGQRAATAEGYRLLRDLDDALRETRPVETAGRAG